MMLCSYTKHTNTTKYLHCYKIYKCNNYEYKKRNLISRSGYRFTAQHRTKVNIKKVQYKVQNSRNILTNILSCTDHTKVMSTLHAIKLGGEVVCKDRSVSTGASSLNGHDGSYIMSAKKAVLKVPTLGRKSTNMQLPDFLTLVANNTTPLFLFGDCMTSHSKLSLAISLLKLSSSLDEL